MGINSTRKHSKYRWFAVTRNYDKSITIKQSHPGKAGVVEADVRFLKHSWTIQRTFYVLAKNKKHALQLLGWRSVQ